MRKIKFEVGQIRIERFKGNRGYNRLYVVTRIVTHSDGSQWIDSIDKYGNIEEYLEDYIDQDELVASYPTWIQAVNSKEFINI